MSRPHIHEPIALAALAAAAISLQALWILNLLSLRIVPVAEWLTLVPQLGPASGLYAFVASAYLVVFILSALLLRGRDCSHLRDGLFWFFAASLAAFAILTLPFVIGFGGVV